MLFKIFIHLFIYNYIFNSHIYNYIFNSHYRNKILKMIFLLGRSELNSKFDEKSMKNYFSLLRALEAKYSWAKKMLTFEKWNDPIVVLYRWFDLIWDHFLSDFILLIQNSRTFEENSEIFHVYIILRNWNFFKAHCKVKGVFLCFLLLKKSYSCFLAPSLKCQP